MYFIPQGPYTKKKSQVNRTGWIFDISEIFWKAEHKLWRTIGLEGLLNEYILMPKLSSKENDYPW